MTRSTCSKLRLHFLCIPVIAVTMICGAKYSAAQAEPSAVHQFTTTPSDARYEIVQSPLAAKWTFRLDRVTGQVSLLVRTKSDDMAWGEMRVYRLPKSSGTSPRYTIFTSGLAARHTFLLDTSTGSTWLLTTTKTKQDDGTTIDVYSWEPFAD